VRQAIALIPVLLVVAGCGGDGRNGDGDSDQEAQARSAVAAYLSALAEGNPQTACDALTEQGRARAVQVGTLAARELGADPVPEGDCLAATAVIADRLPEAGVDEVRRLSEGVDDGEIEGETVEVALGDDRSGLVTPTIEGTVVPVPVERLGERWLIADPASLLLGTGG
jgi:hypothetical protein